MRSTISSDLREKEATLEVRHILVVYCILIVKYDDTLAIGLKIDILDSSTQACRHWTKCPSRGRRE